MKKVKRVVRTSRDCDHCGNLLLVMAYVSDGKWTTPLSIYENMRSGCCNAMVRSITDLVPIKTTFAMETYLNPPMTPTEMVNRLQTGYEPQGECPFCRTNYPGPRIWRRLCPCGAEWTDPRIGGTGWAKPPNYVPAAESRESPPPHPEETPPAPTPGAPVSRPRRLNQRLPRVVPGLRPRRLPKRRCSSGSGRC